MSFSCIVTCSGNFYFGVGGKIHFYVHTADLNTVILQLSEMSKLAEQSDIETAKTLSFVDSFQQPPQQAQEVGSIPESHGYHIFDVM